MDNNSTTSIQRKTYSKNLTFCSMWLLALFLTPIALVAQTPAGSTAGIETRTIISRPTAGILPKGALATTLGVLPAGTLELGLYYSPLVNVELGVFAYGIGIVGSGDIEFPNETGIHVAWRILDETTGVPALTLGVNTVGEFPSPQSSLAPFVLPGPGAYTAASKHYLLLGTLDVHGGVGYVFSWPGNTEGMNIWAGFEKSIGSRFSLNAEVQYFTPALINQQDGLVAGASLLAYLGRGLTMELQVFDILETIADAPERRLQIHFITFL